MNFQEKLKKKTFIPDKPCDFDFTQLSGELYWSTLSRLRTADIDQEVKERAIACMGQIIAHLGDSLQGELPTCLPIFLDRLRNEITRLTTVKVRSVPYLLNLYLYLLN